MKESIGKSLNAISLFLYTTARYPGTELNAHLATLDDLHQEDRATLDRLLEKDSKTPREKRHAERMAALKLLQDYQAKHPLLVRYWHQAAALGKIE